MPKPFRSRYLEYLLATFTAILLVTLSLTCIFDPLIKTGWMEITGLVLGLGLLLLQSLKIIKALRRASSDYIILKSETGSIRVHAFAIEEALRRTAKSIPEVHDVRVRLITDKQTRVPSSGEVDARIKDMTNIVSVHDTLSRVLAERYEQIIPGAPPISFHLTIKHHFKPPDRHHRGRKRIVPPEEDETKAIRAPQYPVPE